MPQVVLCGRPLSYRSVYDPVSRLRDEPIVVYRSAVGHYRIELGAFALDSGGDWDDGFLRGATDTRFTLTYSRDDLSATATVDNLGGGPATRTCRSGAAMAVTAIPTRACSSTSASSADERDHQQGHARSRSSSGGL